MIFDLETNGFGRKAEICQIAAKSNDEQFNVYIVPRKSIPARVTEVTGLHVREGELFLHGRAVQTTPSQSALLSFISFRKVQGDFRVPTKKKN